MKIETLLIVLLLNPLIYSFKLNTKLKNSFSTSYSNRLTALYQYVPPECDPEYRGVIKTSLLRDQIIGDTLLPLPRENDVVIYPNEFGEQLLGTIKYLRTGYYGNETSWVADILPLIEGKSENVFIIDRNAKSQSLSTDKLKPAKFFFVRAENGFKITFSSNSSAITNISLRSLSYRTIDSTMKPQSKVSWLLKNIEKLIICFLGY